LPDERAQMMYRAAAIVEERRERLPRWLVRESGSTRIKANIKIASMRLIACD
jgi:acyl-CoA reductase-like NAD-dependent aldehyde dehydrogenase